MRSTYSLAGYHPVIAELLQSQRCALGVHDLASVTTSLLSNSAMFRNIGVFMKLSIKSI